MAVREMYGPAARGRVAGEVEVQRRNGREKKEKLESLGEKIKKVFFCFLVNFVSVGLVRLFPSSDCSLSPVQNHSVQNPALRHTVVKPGTLCGANWFSKKIDRKYI